MRLRARTSKRLQNFVKSPFTKDRPRAPSCNVSLKGTLATGSYRVTLSVAPEQSERRVVEGPRWSGLSRQTSQVRPGFRFEHEADQSDIEAARATLDQFSV